VEGIPELGNNEQVLALHDTLVDRALDTLASLDLVAVVACAVKEAVAGLDGVVDLVGAGVIVELHGGRRHGSGGEASV
jgi:hypothetical protein